MEDKEAISLLVAVKKYLTTHRVVVCPKCNIENLFRLAVRPEQLESLRKDYIALSITIQGTRTILHDDSLRIKKYCQHCGTSLVLYLYMQEVEYLLMGGTGQAKEGGVE